MPNILKKIITVLLFLGVSLSSVLYMNGAVTFFDGTEVVIPYNSPELGLDNGVNLVKEGVKDINTTGTFSGTVQEIIIYLLSFVTVVAVIYIIYAGFRILTSSGDEETIKKSKNTIIYVIIGIVVIWFAWTIANFAINIGTGGTL